MINGSRYKSASIHTEDDPTDPRNTRRLNNKLMLKGHSRFKHTKSYVLFTDFII